MSRFPGPRSKAMLDELGLYVLTEPWPFVVDLAESRGMWLATVDGDRIFDWSGYYASRLLGHNHPRLSEPDYLARLSRAANNKVPNPDFLTPECLEYYRAIHELAPECMRGEGLEVYAVNSGAEAVENMMKYLINRFHEKVRQRGDNPMVRRFIYFDRAFHGRTIGALNVTNLGHSPIVTKDFRGIMPGNIQVPFPHVDNSRADAANEAEIDKALAIVEDCLERTRGEVIGILVEPIQGAGGHRTASRRFFQQLSQLAHDHDAYLAFDEVQTAGGQCGKVFAVDLLDLPFPPDAVAVAKKFANGVVYMRQPMTDRGVLDSTWGGTLADMVRFVQEQAIVRDERLIEQVPSKAEKLVGGLEEIEGRHRDKIFNVRGLGLYQGFSVRQPEALGRLGSIALENEELLMLHAGERTIRLRPPLDVTLDEIGLFLDKLERSVSAL